MNLFLKLEKIYPFLGDVFIDYHFDKSNVTVGNNFLIHKDLFDDDRIYNNFTDETAKNIIKSIVENVSLEYSVETINYKGNDVIFRKQNNLFM